MYQSHFWEATCWTAIQRKSYLLWYLKFHSPLHKWPSLERILDGADCVIARHQFTLQNKYVCLGHSTF